MVDAILHEDPPSLVELDDPGAAPARPPAAPHARQGPGAPAAGHARGGRRPGDDPPRRKPRARADAAAAAPAVVVIGFDNITKVPEDEWLGTGIAETVAADLRAVEGLTVISRERTHEVLRKLESAGAVSEQDLAARLGRELGARWVLRGGYQRFGDRVRVTALLTDVESGTVIRTVKIDGGMDEIFSVQDRIVAELSAGLRMTVAPRKPRPGRDPGHRGVRGVLARHDQPPGGEPRVRRPRDPLPRARDRPRPVLCPGPPQARLRLRDQGLVPGHARAVREGHRPVPPRHRAPARAGVRVARAGRGPGRAVPRGRRDRGDPPRPDPRSRGRRRPRHAWDARTSSASATSAAPPSATRRPSASTRRPGWYVLQLAHCYALLRDFERGEDGGAPRGLAAGGLPLRPGRPPHRRRAHAAGAPGRAAGPARGGDRAFPAGDRLRAAGGPRAAEPHPHRAAPAAGQRAPAAGPRRRGRRPSWPSPSRGSSAGCAWARTSRSAATTPPARTRCAGTWIPRSTTSSARSA